MASIDVTENGWRTRVSYGATAMSYPELSALLGITMAVRSMVPLERFKFERDANDPLVYDYRIWLTGGRIWKQTLSFVGATDSNPTMTFDVAPGWKLSEFAAHRELRDAMVRMRNRYDLWLARLDPA